MKDNITAKKVENLRALIEAVDRLCCINQQSS